MTRRSILSAHEKLSLVALPESDMEFIRHYSLSDADISIIKQKRGNANKLGFAIQLSYMRYPGITLAEKETPNQDLLDFIANQIGCHASDWQNYGVREVTKREHALELQQIFGYRTFSREFYSQHVEYITALATETTKGIILAEHLVNYLRGQKILLPTVLVIEKICAQAMTQANKIIYDRLTADLTQSHLDKLDNLLTLKDGSKLTHLAWLRQSPTKPTSRQMNAHIDRLKYCLSFDLSDEIGQRIHQNRLLKIAREGGQMQATDLAKFENKRRYATLVALMIESKATIIDEIIDLHDHIIRRIFNQARNKHQQHFIASAKAINQIILVFKTVGQAMLVANTNHLDLGKAVESVTTWEDFAQNVEIAQSLFQPNDFDFLPKINDHYRTFRLYAPAMLDILSLQATSSSNNLMRAINVLRDVSKQS